MRLRDSSEVMSLKVRSSTPDSPVGTPDFGSRAYARTKRIAAGTVIQNAQQTPKLSPSYTVSKQLIIIELTNGTMAKLNKWNRNTDDAEANERKYEGIDVINMPAEIGRKAPTHVIQNPNSNNLVTKLFVLPLKGPAKAAMAIKLQAIRNAAA